MSLLAISLKYQVLALASLTQKFVSAHITIDTCLQLLADADTLDASDLYEESMAFICKNWGTVCKLPGINMLSHDLLLRVVMCTGNKISND